jgi:3-oxoacyl-[acyl-carrier-protein] synthase-3
VVTNDDLSKVVDTNDEWISTRTGIKSRRLALPGARNVDFAAQAAQHALAEAGIDAARVDIIIAATFTPDSFVPGLASLLVDRLACGAQTFAFDLGGACCGFLYALRAAQGQLALNPDATVLVVASELVSSVIDFTDRSTCVLFGDGAGAAVVRASETPSYFTAGSAGNSSAIVCDAHYEGAKPGIKMKGQEVFRFACTAIERCIDDLLQQSGLDLDDVDYVVCHQANARIINHVIKHRHADPAKFFMNVDHYGNTSAASIALALAEMDQQGLLVRGQKILMVGFGAGLTEGGMLLTW